MKKILTFLIFLTTFLNSHAQEPGKDTNSSREILTGTWSLVAVENILPDKSKVLPYGENPQGLLVFDSKGNYAIQILKALRPKIVANDKNKATSAENAALVQGNNSHFGTYSIDEINHTLTFHIERAFYPNWEGTTQHRSYTLNGSVLQYIVTNTTNGGDITAVVVWKQKE